MRRVLLIILLGIFAPAVWGQDFVSARAVGDPISPTAFVLKLGGFDCRLNAAGTATCARGAARWRFRLPTAGGSIEHVFVSGGSELVVVYEVSDFESNWAYVARMEPRRHRPEWHEQIAGLNTAMPVLIEGSVVVAALGYIASFAVGTGLTNWEHSWMYEAEAGTDVRLEVTNALACYRSGSYDGRDRLVQCFEVRSGKQAPAPDTVADRPAR
jgi:hypothetical protein